MTDWLNAPRGQSFIASLMAVVLASAGAAAVFTKSQRHKLITRLIMGHRSCTLV